MRRPILVAAVAFVLIQTNAVQAQIGYGPARPPTFKSGFLFGGFPPAYGLNGRGNPLARGYRSSIIVPLGFPFFPFNSSGWLGIGTPPIVVASPTVVVLPPVVFSGDPGDPPPRPAPFPADDDAPLGAKPGDHLVIRPKKGIPLLPPPDAVPKVDRVVPPVPRPLPDLNPFAARKIENVDKPDPDPVKELARLLKLGKEAFVAGEFGAAGEQFNRAIAIAPKSALPIFLKAQASFAAGSYAAAVTAIQAGLEVDRNWPNSPFDPKELYAANPGWFNEHLAALRGVIVANPGDPALEFLLGYQLWFIGEKAEARKWFDLAEKGLPAPGPIALFK